MSTDADGGLVGGSDCAAQAEQCFDNVEAALRAAGATLDDVNKITTFLVEADDYPAYAQARLRRFPENGPASSTVIREGAGLPRIPGRDRGRRWSWASAGRDCPTGGRKRQRARGATHMSATVSSARSAPAGRASSTGMRTASSVRDIAPLAPVHLLVIPNRHAGLSESSDGERSLLGEMVDAASRLAVREGVGGSGYRLVINSGRRQRADGGTSSIST